MRDGNQVSAQKAAADKPATQQKEIPQPTKVSGRILQRAAWNPKPAEVQLSSNQKKEQEIQTSLSPELRSKKGQELDSLQSEKTKQVLELMQLQQNQ